MAKKVIKAVVVAPPVNGGKVAKYKVSKEEVRPLVRKLLREDGIVFVVVKCDGRMFVCRPAKSEQKEFFVNPINPKNPLLVLGELL